MNSTERVVRTVDEQALRQAIAEVQRATGRLQACLAEGATISPVGLATLAEHGGRLENGVEKFLGEGKVNV